MTQTWLTADTHFGHDLVARLRGFDTTQQHDASIRRTWMRQVNDDDEVWILGDVSLGGWRSALAALGELPGTKHLVAGNHDRCHPLNSNGHRYQRDYLQYFETVTTVVRLRYKGRTVLLSHFPYDGDHLKEFDRDRATQWRLRDEGRLLMHGHVHDEIRVRASDRGTTMVHVGLDAHSMQLTRLSDLMQDAARFERLSSENTQRGLEGKV